MYRKEGTRVPSLKTKEMENINRGPTFKDFVTILTEGSM
jgi:hypothetical protein